MPHYRWRTYICKTLTCRAHGAPPRHIWRTVHPTATTTLPAGAGRMSARSPQDQGRYPGRLPHPTPCPTVYFYSVRPLHPRDSGEDDDFHVPLLMYSALPYNYKRRRRASFNRDGHLHSRSSSHSQHHRALTSTDSSSSRDCTPYYKHSGCKIIQCPRTPSCWTYGPAAGTRINPCVTVLHLASTSGTRKHAAFTC